MKCERDFEARRKQRVAFSGATAYTDRIGFGAELRVRVRQAYEKSNAPTVAEPPILTDARHQPEPFGLLLRLLSPSEKLA